MTDIFSEKIVSPFKLFERKYDPAFWSTLLLAVETDLANILSNSDTFGPAKAGRRGFTG